MIGAVIRCRQADWIAPEVRRLDGEGSPAMSREGVGQNCAVSQTLLPRRRDDRNAILFAALHESGFGGGLYLFALSDQASRRFMLQRMSLLVALSARSRFDG